MNLIFISANIFVGECLIKREAKREEIMPLKVRYTKLSLLLIILIAFSLILIGCGGGLTSSTKDSVSSNTGSLALKINWPQYSAKSKYIPSNTSKIDISITGEGLNSASNYSITYGQNNITLTGIPVGNKTADIAAKNANDDILAHRKVSFNIEGGKTTTTTIDLGVTVTDSGFTPQAIVISAGTTLLFVNNGNNNHSLSGNSPFNNTLLVPGGSQSITFNTAGIYNYQDGQNPALTGMVGVGPQGRMYVADLDNNSIKCFDRINMVNGDISPDRTISGGATALDNPADIVMDVINDRLYVINIAPSLPFLIDKNILVFNNASTSNGNIAPARNITGPAANMKNPVAIYLDTTNNIIYIAENNVGDTAMLAFNNADTINGNVAPSRKVSFSTSPWDISVAVGKNIAYFAMGNPFLPQIWVYDNASTINSPGVNLAPDRTITSPDLEVPPFDIVLDNSRDQLYVFTETGTKILIFNNASTANGSISASRIITGAATQLRSPGYLFLDTVNDRLYVPSNGQILIFNNASTINGNVAPTRTISGSNTGFVNPRSVFVDVTR